MSTLTTLFTNIANSIRAKKGSQGLISAEDFPDEIDSIETGGGTPSTGVFFIDYDGSIVEAWETSSVVSKTELPTNPTHTGLVAEGWNWSLTDIKSYISNYPEANVYVGQMYHTTSGLTEIDVSMTKVTGKTITMNMVGNKNWGDGTSDNLTTHTYEDYGDYTITCNGTSIPAGSSSSGGMFGTSSSNVNRFWCTAIRISNRVTSIGSYAFYHCDSLTNITIPDSVTSIGTNVFEGCYSVTNITIPDSVTSIGDYVFRYCYSLTNITIPDNVTSIGNYVFDYCNSLTNITTPDSVTSIGNNAFRYCYSVTNITIPDGVTSIGNSVFYNCYSVTNITIPDGVTSIGTNVFYNCYSIIKYDFTSATAIPALSNTNAFSSINGICKIIVPDALYNDWIAATNWSNFADYIYKASEIDNI